MKSLTQAQEATGKAHITIQVHPAECSLCFHRFSCTSVSHMGCWCVLQGGATSAGVAPLQVAAMIAKKKGTASSVKK